MEKCNRFSFFTIILISAIGIFSSCERHIFVADNLISDKLKYRIDSFNHLIVNKCVEKDSVGFMELLGYSGDKKFSFYDFVADIKKENFDVLNQFYYLGEVNKISPSLLVNNKKIGHYRFSFVPVCNEMFVSLLASDSGLLLKLMYGIENQQWRLCYLISGRWSIEGRNIYDWFHLAESDYDAGKLWKAFREILFVDILSGSSIGLEYSGKAEMKQYVRKIGMSFGNEFQKKMDMLTNQPTLLRLAWFKSENAYLPKVYYKTSIPLSDTIALRQECESVHRCFWDLADKDFDGGRKTYYEICSTDDDRKVDLEIILEETNGLLKFY